MIQMAAPARTRRIRWIGRTKTFSWTTNSFPLVGSSYLHCSSWNIFSCPCVLLCRKCFIITLYLFHLFSSAECCNGNMLACLDYASIPILSEWFSGTDDSKEHWKWEMRAPVTALFNSCSCRTSNFSRSDTSSMLPWAFGLFTSMTVADEKIAHHINIIKNIHKRRIFI